MLTYLSQYEELFGPLRLFTFLTFRCAAAAATALFIGFILGPWVIRKLRMFKLNQALRSQGEVGRLADLHASKAGTPTMGGLLIYFSVTATVLLWARPNRLVLVCLIVYTGLTLLGFLDDYLKVSRKNSKGLSGRYKLVGQALLTLVALGIMLSHPVYQITVTELWIPFLKAPLIATMPLVLVIGFFFLVMAGSSNAINLTDGADGLAIGCTITVALVYGIIAYAAGNTIIADYLLIGYIPGAGEMAVVCSALVGGGMAFLWYNCHPAEVFMGDTGSLALGGLIGTMAFLVQQPFTLVIVGGIFVLEALSVIMQVFSFKTTGRRIFRMAPIHHHFELGGWPETKVVIRFWILSLMFAIAGLSTLKLR